MNEVRFFDKAARLDAVIIKGGQGHEAIEEVADLLKEPPLRRYFFERLDRPEWLHPLEEEGYFSAPPQPLRDEEDRIRFPPWPESGYLARMAIQAPEVVAGILQRMPATDNIRVREDIIDAALAMPPGLAANFVEDAIAWLSSPHLQLLPIKLGELVEHLAMGSQVDHALDLAEALLTLQPGSRATRTGGDAALWSFADPQPRFDVWDYQEILKDSIPKLIAAAGERALLLLCRVLEDAARLSVSGSHQEGREGSSREDYFYIQRPAIEEHTENESYWVVGSLISAVRDAAEQLVIENRISVRRAVQVFEQKPFHIFDRLALYLLWRFPQTEPTLIAEKITDRRLFDEVGLRHEYALLARRCFAALLDKHKETILRWIEEGPDLESYKSRSDDWDGREPSEQDTALYADRWRRNKLALFEAGLPEGWQQRYAQLVERLGPADDPTVVGYTTTVWIDLKSPRTAEDLQSMTVEDIVGFLRSWEPSENLESPSPEGLGRELTVVVASDPEPFADASSRFRDLDPTYIRALFNGLRDAVKQGRFFSWASVLNLCEWVVQQPIEIPGRKTKYDELIRYHGLDPDWSYSRKAVADLITDSVRGNAGDAQIPFELQSRVWSVIRPLSEDPNPTPDFEEQYGGTNMDPATLSLNTVRGQAMHAVVRYALWVRQNLMETFGVDEDFTKWFDDMPEVQEVLERRLNPEVEPSPTVRAVYGWWFPQLVLLDEAWAVGHVSKIFPSYPAYSHLRDAAWGAYLTISSPYDLVFDILSEEYYRAVERLSFTRTGRWMTADPDHRLVEHLMSFYWRGKLDLEGQGSILRMFYTMAPRELHAHALRFVGTTLYRMGSELADDASMRLRALWEERLAAARAGLGAQSGEIQTFGWWFVSGKFDDDWAITQLNEVLKLTGEVEADHLVLERLVDLAPSMPATVVECLKWFVENEREPWRLYTSKGSQRMILSIALQSADHKAQRLAEDVVNRLGARGHFDFKNLLHERGS